MLRHLLPALAALSFLAGVQSTSAPGALTFTAPQGWKPRTAASTMRVAEFIIPGPGGASQDAELVIYSKSFDDFLGTLSVAK